MATSATSGRGPVAADASERDTLGEVERLIAGEQAPKLVGEGGQQVELPAPALTLLRDLAAQLCSLQRHLSLHNGGVVLTREPLLELLPVRVSANGVRALEADKDDVERLGLIKFDMLGLRTLGAMEEALALIEETTGVRPGLDALPPHRPIVWAAIRHGGQGGAARRWRWA